MIITPPKDTNKPSQIVQISPRQEMIQFPNGLKGEMVFLSTFQHLEELFTNIGLHIPSTRTNEFPTSKNGCIFLHDPGFARAFLEIYLPSMIKHDRTNYRWEELSSTGRS